MSETLGNEPTYLNVFVCLFVLKNGIIGQPRLYLNLPPKISLFTKISLFYFSGMDGSMVLDEIQRFKYRHCYRKQPRSPNYRAYSHFQADEGHPSSNSDDSLPELIPLESSRLQIPQPTVEEIQQIYLNSLQELKFDPDLSKELLQYHLKVIDIYPWNKLFLHLKKHESQLDSFARKLPSFPLCSEERLAKGRNLHLNYTLAKYLTASTAKEQIRWLNNDLHSDMFLEEEKLRHLPLEAAIQFFNGFIGESTQTFKNCLQVIEYFKIPKEISGALTYYFLYQDLPGDSSLNSEYFPKEIMLEAENILLKQCRDHEIPMERGNLHSIIGALELMSTLFL